MTGVLQRDRSRESSVAKTNGRQDFVAVVLYESSSPAASYVPLYDESIIVVRASSLEDARRIIEARAATEAVTFTNEAGETMTWSLRRIVDVTPLLEEAESEVRTLYSRHFRDIASYELFEPLLNGSIETDRT